MAQKSNVPPNVPRGEDRNPASQENARAHAAVEDDEPLEWGDHRYADWEQDSPGAYRGLGPKGYERSDAGLKEIICERLTESPHIDASRITVEVKRQQVNLSGFVRSYRMKQAVQDLVESCRVSGIDNRLEVPEEKQT